jgi:hypothetical protein
MMIQTALGHVTVLPQSPGSMDPVLLCLSQITKTKYLSIHNFKRLKYLVLFLETAFLPLRKLFRKNEFEVGFASSSNS